MGRTLLIEEALQNSINQLFGNEKSQVGLVIGQFSESKDFAIHFVRCPDPVDDEVEIEMSSSDDEVKVVKNKTKSKKKNAVDDDSGIDTKWIVEHARQVNRMMTGGISVLGIYIFCSSDTLTKNQTKLRGCLQSVQKKIERNKFIRQSLPHNYRYLLHLCPTSRKITCRTVDLTDDQVPLIPAEYRYQQFLTNWNYVSTCVDINVQFHVPISQEASQTENKILYACQTEIEDIWNAFATTGFKLIDKTKAIVDNKSKKIKLEEKEVKILLFKQANSGKCKKLLKYDKANVVVKLVGSICSKAYLNSKATYGDAEKALKLDIIRSLLTRIELLCEEAEINNMCQVEEWSLMSPTRVYAPFKKDSVHFCDYIFKDESEEDTLGRFSELLNITPPKEDLFYPERSPEISEVSMILHGDKQIDHQSDIASELSSMSSPDEPRDKKLLAAMFAGVTAMFAAAIHFLSTE